MGFGGCRGNGNEEQEEMGPERGGGTTECGELTDRAGMLLKNKTIEQAVWVIAIARGLPETATGCGEREFVGRGQRKKGAKRVERSQYVTWNQRVNSKNEPKRSQ
jgi:hypothetical protein